MGRRHGRLAGALGLGAAFAVLALGIDRGLLEPSEGRYGSVAAEMLRTGDYLVPRLNEVAHFEKPPLSMWAMAASMRLFGVAEWAIRLPGALAALAGVVVAFLLGSRLRPGSELLAASLVLASPLFFGMAKVLTTDVYLAAFAGATILCVARAHDHGHGRARSRLLTAAAVLSALGFLTKGPVIWILTLLPVVAEVIWSKSYRDLRTLFSPLRIALFLLVVLPWFLAVGLREPGLLEWFVTKRTAQVLVSAKGFHSGPLWYFAPVFLLGLLPGGLILLFGGREGWVRLRASRRGRLLVCAVVVPFVVFSLSKSKLATYLLPLAVPTAALAAVLVDEGIARRGVVAASCVSVLLVIGGLVAGPFLRDEGIEGPAALCLAGAGVVVGLGALGSLALIRAGRDRRACFALTTCQIVALALCAGATSLAGGRLEAGREIATAVRDYAADGKPIVSYRCLVRSLPFYTGRKILLVDWYEWGEVREAERKAVEIGIDDLRDLLAREPVAVVCRKKTLDELREVIGPLREIEASGRYVLLGNEPAPSGEDAR